MGALIAFATDWATMHFVFYPKHEFGCPHVGACPHLGGASLSLLVHAADRETEWINALHRQNDALREENTAKHEKIQELTARVEQLQRELTAERQKQFKRRKEEPAKEELDSPPRDKKRGAPLGHPGWYRPRPEAFDELILVSAPQSCPHCGGSVKARPDRAVYDHLQEDWIDGKHVTVCYRHEASRCRKCRRWVKQLGKGELPRAMLGPNLRAASLFLQYDIGYDRHQTRIKQRCLAHLKRTAETWCKLLPKDAPHSRAFYAAVIQWVKRGCAWHRKRKNSPRPAKDAEANWLRQELERLQVMPTDSPRALRLQKRLRRYRKEWLTFLDHPGMAPTNNLAEQALRAVVILRKLTFGSRTRAGAKRLGRMMTVIETAKRQGKCVLKFLVSLFTMSPNQAMRAMYARP